MVSILVSLFFSKAFDSINARLWYKLKSRFRFSSVACDLIYSYLCDRKQSVVLGSDESTLKNVKPGATLSSILGPILFCLYIDDMIDTITNYSARIGGCYAM